MEIHPLIQRIDELSTRFHEEFKDVPTEKLQQKPSSDAWSIAQVIQHLIDYNESYYPSFWTILEDGNPAPWHAKVPFLARLLGHLLLKVVSEPRKMKVKTFATWDPSESEISSDILQRFIQHQEELKEWYRSLEPYTERNIILPSPAKRAVVYSLDTALKLIVEHEARHLEQAREVKEGLGA